MIFLKISFLQQKEENTIKTILHKILLMKMEEVEYRPLYTFDTNLVKYETVASEISHFKFRMIESTMKNIKDAFNLFPKVDPPLDKYSFGKRKMIYEDPFSFYIPYHLDYENWGIYVRVNWILNDLKRYLTVVINFTEINKVVSDLGYQGILHAGCDTYFTHLAKHALVHHAIEDVALILEEIQDCYGKIYPMFDKVEEDRFAEYFSFSTYGLATFYVFRKALRNILDVRRPLVDFVFKVIHGTFQSSLSRMRDYFEQITKPLEFLSDLLYSYWSVNEVLPYHPVMRKNIIEKISPLWDSIVNSHMGFIPPLYEAINCLEHIPENVKRAITEEIYDRVFATTL